MKYTLSLHAIVFVDLANYTQTTSLLNAETFSLWQHDFDQITASTVEQFNGTIVKKLGDAFLMVFPTVTQAIGSSIALQKAFEQYNKEHKNVPFNAKIGVHMGEVLWQKNDVYGTAVNITSRIVNIAEAGEILFSGSAYLAMDKSEFTFEHVGRHRVKGVGIPVRLFKVCINPRKKTEKDLLSNWFEYAKKVFTKKTATK